VATSIRRIGHRDDRIDGLRADRDALIRFQGSDQVR